MNKSGDEENELYTVTEAANLLRVSVRTIRQMIRDGELRAAKVGKEYRIRKSDIEALWKQQ